VFNTEEWQEVIVLQLKANRHEKELRLPETASFARAVPQFSKPPPFAPLKSRRLVAYPQPAREPTAIYGVVGTNSRKYSIECVIRMRTEVEAMTSVPAFSREDQPNFRGAKQKDLQNGISVPEIFDVTGVMLFDRLRRRCYAEGRRQHALSTSTYRVALFRMPRLFATKIPGVSRFSTSTTMVPIKYFRYLLYRSNAGRSSLRRHPAHVTPDIHQAPAPANGCLQFPKRLISAQTRTVLRCRPHGSFRFRARWYSSGLRQNRQVEEYNR
jgi:hypothetical protein